MLWPVSLATAPSQAARFRKRGAIPGQTLFTRLSANCQATRAPTRNKLLPNALQTTNDKSVAAQHTTSCQRVAELPKILIRPACATHRDRGAREGFRGTFCGFRGHLLRNPGKASAELCITPREPSAEGCIQIWPMPCGRLLRNLRAPSAESAAAFCGRLQYPVVTPLQGSSA